MEIIAHKMQYNGGRIESDLKVVHYCDSYYEEYKAIYQDCFRPMRTALGLSADCCDTREQLLKKQADLYLLMIDGHFAGSVATYGNEIDDLIVNPNDQGKGYGKKLLLYAVSNLQNKGIEPITLHVADWNKKAVHLYLQSGFQCIQTEKVLREEQNPPCAF